MPNGDPFKIPSTAEIIGLNNIERIGYKERADGRPSDGDHLGWLNEHRQLAVLHHEATNDRSEDHYQPDNREHDSPFLNPLSSYGRAGREASLRHMVATGVKTCMHRLLRFQHEP